MTREEAIESIQDFIGWFKKDKPIYKALEMAIKALEQEPTDTWSIKDVADTFKKHGLIREQEQCEDTVSRKEIIEHYTTGEMANVHHIDKNHLLAFVEQLPPVRPQ